MRFRNLLLLVLAVVLFGGTMLLARSWLASQRAQEVVQAAPAAPPRPAHSVLVAKLGLTRGQILKPEDVAWQIWPDGALDQNYIVQGGPQTPQSLTGFVAVYPVAGGEPITKAKLIAPGDRGYLAAVLRPGMRAISVPVTQTTTEAGLVYPGDRVDVLLTYQWTPEPPPGQSKEAREENKEDKVPHQVAETVLHNVRVIGIDEDLGGKPGEHTSYPNARNATLEVTPKQTEVIVLASRMGSLTLVLRSLVPGGSDLTTAERGEDSDTGAPDPAAETPATPRLAAAAQTVTLIANHDSDAPADETNETTDSSNPAAPAGGPRIATPAPIGTNTTTARTATYTTDNEISSLISPLSRQPWVHPEEKAEEPVDLTKFWVAKGPSELGWSHPESQGGATPAEPDQAAQQTSAAGSKTSGQ
jgi:pilus assembly protein CpaB